MQIRVTERGSESFYRELVNIMSQYRKILQKPEGKLLDMFKVVKTYIGIAIAFLVLLVLMAIFWGGDLLTYVAIFMMVAIIAYSIYLLYNLNALYKTYMNDSGDSILTLDEDGIELDKENSTKVRLSWDKIAFARVYNESITFIPKNITTYIICITRKYEDEIVKYLVENKSDFRIYR